MNQTTIPAAVAEHLAEGDRLHDELIDLAARLRDWHKVQRQLVPAETEIEKPASPARADGLEDHPEFLRKSWHLGRIVHGGTTEESVDQFDLYLGSKIDDLEERIRDVRAAAEQGKLPAEPRVRKPRYAPGDVVILHAETGYEGPHPSDGDAPIRIARVAEAIEHPNNSTWVTDYVVEEFYGFETIAERGVERSIPDTELDRIRPGEISRLARPSEIAERGAEFLGLR